MEFLDLKTGEVKLNAQIFEQAYRPVLIHQVVTTYQNVGRSGTKAQKSRGEVAGSTKKLWRQKGTGRARVGAVSNPLWRSGGVIFAAKPRDFNLKTNRKMYRGAMRSIFSQLLREERIQIVDQFDLASEKTKPFKAWLDQCGVAKALLIDEEVSLNLRLASRNIPNILALSAHQISPVELVRYPKTIMTTKALKRFEELLAC